MANFLKNIEKIGSKVNMMKVALDLFLIL